MNINYKPTQFELFPAKSATLEDIDKHPLLLASLTLSIENLVILVILGIMIALFSFSLGVERGRGLAAQSLDEKAAAAWNVGGRRLAVAPVVPQVVKPAAAVNSSRNFGNKGFVRSTAFTQPTIAPRPKTMPAATVAGSGKWTVQVATYRNENYAQQEALGVRAKGFPTFILKSKDFYLVCVGQFASQAQADSFSQKVQAKYNGSQVRRF